MIEEYVETMNYLMESSENKVKSSIMKIISKLANWVKKIFLNQKIKMNFLNCYVCRSDLRNSRFYFRKIDLGLNKTENFIFFRFCEKRALCPDCTSMIDGFNKITRLLIILVSLVVFLIFYIVF